MSPPTQSPSGENLAQRAGRALWNQWAPLSFTRSGMPVYVRGEGAYLWDEAGRRHLDALSGLWCAPLGHGRPEIIEAVSRQLKTLSYAPLDWRAHAPAVELAERLLALSPPGMERVFFCSGGSEGVEAALRLARQYMTASGQPERRTVLYRAKSYHGSTPGAAGVSGLKAARLPGEPASADCVEVCQVDCCGCAPGKHAADCGARCVAKVEEAILRVGPKRVAAMIAEPITASGPVLLPPPDYWQRLQEMLSRHGILLILDEVQTGFGRTGRMLAASHWDIKPDLLVLAKGLSGGYVPLGAVLASGKVAKALESALMPGYTFGGHPAACAAALAALNILEGVLDNASARGVQLMEGLAAAARPHSFAGPVSGLGLLISVGLKIPPQRLMPLMAALNESGLLCLVEESSLCLAPPLIIGDEEVAMIVDGVRRALEGAAV